MNGFFIILLALGACAYGKPLAENKTVVSSAISQKGPVKSEIVRKEPRQDEGDDGDGDDGEDSAGAAGGAAGAAANAGGPSSVAGLLLSGLTGGLFTGLIPGEAGQTLSNVYNTVTKPINNFLEGQINGLIKAQVQAATTRRSAPVATKKPSTTGKPVEIIEYDPKSPGQNQTNRFSQPQYQSQQQLSQQQLQQQFQQQPQQQFQQQQPQQQFQQQSQQLQQQSQQQSQLQSQDSKYVIVNQAPPAESLAPPAKSGLLQSISVSGQSLLSASGQSSPSVSNQGQQQQIQQNPNFVNPAYVNGGGNNNPNNSPSLVQSQIHQQQQQNQNYINPAYFNGGGNTGINTDHNNNYVVILSSTPRGLNTFQGNAAAASPNAGNPTELINTTEEEDGDDNEDEDGRV